MTCTKKFILHRHITMRGFISVLIWDHIVYLIFLWMTYNMTYLKFLFLDSFLSHNLIWHSPYCMHIICHLCFSRHIRFTNYNLHVNANRYMWMVQISTILEGFTCPMFGGKGFGEFTPKARRVSSIFLLPSDVFWCPPYCMSLRYHHNFRGPLRLTNDNFHTHILYC